MAKRGKRILILGGSGFLGAQLYKELQAYFDVYATFHTGQGKYHNNKRFQQWDAYEESPALYIKQIKPDVVISAFRTSETNQIQVHQELAILALEFGFQIIYFSSSNVFDAFTNYPSYEYDKTLSVSSYGKYQIRIENLLMRLPEAHFCIARLPMIFGHESPRIQEIKWLYQLNEAIEVFPNVVINATVFPKITQQIHYIINRELAGIFHIGSSDLIHHNELIEEICFKLQLEKPLFKQVYDSNDDRFLAPVPKDHPLPQHLEISMEEVIKKSIEIK